MEILVMLQRLKQSTTNYLDQALRIKVEMSAQTSGVNGNHQISPDHATHNYIFQRPLPSLCASNSPCTYVHTKVNVYEGGEYLL
jgi:hypothetical protein